MKETIKESFQGVRTTTKTGKTVPVKEPYFNWIRLGNNLCLRIVLQKIQQSASN